MSNLLHPNPTTSLLQDPDAASRSSSPSVIAGHPLPPAALLLRPSTSRSSSDCTLKTRGTMSLGLGGKNQAVAPAQDQFLAGVVEPWVKQTERGPSTPTLAIVDKSPLQLDSGPADRGQTDFAATLASHNGRRRDSDRPSDATYGGDRVNTHNSSSDPEVVEISSNGVGQPRARRALRETTSKSPFRVSDVDPGHDARFQSSYGLGVRMQDAHEQPYVTPVSVISGTYVSDVGSGISSQSSSQSSPDTSPIVPASADIQRLSPRLGVSSRKHTSQSIQSNRRVRLPRAQVEDEGSYEARSKSGSVASPPSDLHPDHIVFDTVPSSGSRRASRVTADRRSSSPSVSVSAKSASVASASPALSSSRNFASRRASAARSAASDSDHGHELPQQPEYTDHLTFPLTTNKPGQRAPSLHSVPGSGPGSLTGTIFPSRPHKNPSRPITAPDSRQANTAPPSLASALAQSAARDSTYGLTFPSIAKPSNAQTQAQVQLAASTRRNPLVLGDSALPWEQEGLDELDWMVAAQSRRVDPEREEMAPISAFPDANLLSLAVNTQQQGQRDYGDDDEPQLAPQSASGTSAGTDTAMELALAQTSLWVMDTFAAQAVGENQRRMSAIGEEAEAEVDSAANATGLATVNENPVRAEMGPDRTPTPPPLRNKTLDKSPRKSYDNGIPAFTTPPTSPTRASNHSAKTTPTRSVPVAYSPGRSSMPRAPSLTSARSKSTLSRFGGRLGAFLGGRTSSSPSRTNGGGNAGVDLGISSETVKAKMIVAEQQERDRVEEEAAKASAALKRERDRDPKLFETRTAESARFESLLEQFQREERERIRAVALARAQSKIPEAGLGPEIGQGQVMALKAPLETGGAV